MSWAYILECNDATLYVGSTTDLVARIRQHESGLGAIYTERRRPVRLVWCAEFDEISAAFAFEKQVQGWSRAKKLALIEGDDDRIRALSAAGVRPSAVHVKTDHLPTIVTT